MKPRKRRKGQVGIRPRRLLYFAFLITGAVLRMLPRRLAFDILVILDAFRFLHRARLCAAYLPYVTSFLVEEPDWRFAGRLSRALPESAANVLFGIGAYRETSDWILTNGPSLVSKEATKLAARSLFEYGEFDRARTTVAARASIVDLEQDPQLAFQMGMFDIIGGDRASAVENMSRACRNSPGFMRPHQNIASRPERHYIPNSFDTFAGANGRLFDLGNFTGQRVTHVGHGDIGVRLFEQALEAQSALRALPQPVLSSELLRLLKDADVTFDELRIIPEEWTTQIGHLGMLDILLRMRELGWWSGKAIMVVRPELVANKAFFRLFENFGKVVVVGETVSEETGEELLSLQRWCGLNFNAFRLPTGNVVAWQEAGALAMEQWEREGRGHPLRDAFDRVFGSSDYIHEGFQNICSKWGMKPDDWYVCLHTRDASHYLEFNGTGQSHRNAPIEASMDAIRFITSQGGWVIKLGGPNSPKLPRLERTVDYALSEYRSDLMDIHLIRHARAFIGTTSGLTNVAMSFGIPSAIVNAITTDAQLWHSNVRFALKRVRLADGTMLTQHQLTSAPWRWKVFDAAVLGRAGGLPINNTADEILQTVKEVEALASGRSAEFEAQYDTEALLSAWRRQLTLPNFYGASRPSLDFLARHKDEFLREPPDAA